VRVANKPLAPRRSGRVFGESKAMNILRIQIVSFWLLFVLFWLLLYFCWRYRFLWVALFPTAVVFLELMAARILPDAVIKPRRRSPMPRRIKALLWLLVIEWVMIVIVHGFLYPHSAVLYLLAKLVLVATSAPLLYYKIRLELEYKAWLDYGAFRAAQNPSAEPGAPPNAGSAGAPPASVS
jgi:hypothetical protein